MATTHEDVLAAVYEKVARNFPDDGPAYADLSGKVYTKEGYIDRLKKDPEFAKQQLTAFVQPPPADDEGITPREQTTIAKRFMGFAKDHSPDFAEFLRANPALVASYSVRDMRRVVDTLRLEFGVQPVLSEELESAEENQPVTALLER